MATIKRRGNSYLIRCYDGYSTDGKQIEKTMTWKIPNGMSEKKAEREALIQAAMFEERVRTGQISGQRVKFESFAHRWFADYAEIQLRPTTVARYREMMVRINAALGHQYIDRIRPAHLMAFYKDLALTKVDSKCYCTIDMKQLLKERGITKTACAENCGVSLSVLSSVYQQKNIERESARKICDGLHLSYTDVFKDEDSGKCLSPKSIQHYHRLISSIMHSAVKWQVIVSNPAERVQPPKVAAAEIEYLDDRQAIKLLEALDTAPVHYRCAVQVLLFTGMRRGELLGLEWRDIDFKSQLVTIQRSSLYLADRGIFEDGTKNTSSNRVIRVPNAAIQALKTMWKWQAEQRDIMGDLWQGSGKVFTALNGSPMHPDTLSGWFRDFIKTTDLPQIHLHSLRHTNATLNIANGTPITTVAGQLGHANATTTAKIYAHAIKSAQAAAADKMDDLLSRNRSKSVS